MRRLTSGRERSFAKTSAALLLEPFIGTRFLLRFKVDFYDAPVNIEFVKVPLRELQRVFYIPTIALLLVVVMSDVEDKPNLPFEDKNYEQPYLSAPQHNQLADCRTRRGLLYL